MTDIPRRAVVRTAKLASLPVGFAGRTALGLGRRIGGQSAEVVAAEVRRRTAEQLFSVLGQLKGGAMKVGQALSVFEAALPEDMAAPYRAALTKLQEAAPPLPATTVHRVLADGLGRDWASRFRHFDDAPAAAASIGQVHRATWADGRDVAVKVQYPGAGAALVGDLRQLGRLARMFGALQPGMDVKPLVVELERRVVEELDYEREGTSTAAFAAAFDGDPEIVAPKVLASAPRVLVTEWIEGTPLSEVIASGTVAERDRAGRLLALAHFSAPARAGLLHADPHPGNYRLLPDGRLGLIDFGAVAHLPDGLPAPIGRLSRLALDGDADGLLDGLRDAGFVPAGARVDGAALLDMIRPILEPLAAERFRFGRAWLRAEAVRLGDPRGPAQQLGRRLNLPPSYLLIHRVTLGSIGVLCQLEAEADYGTILERWLPGFRPRTAPARRP